MNGLPYYKAYPRDFIEGTVGMTFELKATYRLVLDLIYMQAGSLPDDARYISGLLGCSVRAWKKNRQILLDAGKIYAENGIISNFRADKELETLAKFQDKQSENRSKASKNNNLQKPWSNHTEPEPEPYRKPKGFLRARDAPKNKTGFVKPRTVFDAAADYAKSLGEDHDERREDSAIEVDAYDAHSIPAISGRKR